MDLARDSAVTAAAQAAAAAAASGHQDEETVYVEAPEDLANVTVASVAGQPGLHLTTITVAVPHPYRRGKLPIRLYQFHWRFWRIFRVIFRWFIHGNF